MKRKGISLPVEMIVIIALAVIVLLAAGAFFIAGWLPGQVSTIDTQAWSNGCGMVKLRGCTSASDMNLKITNYDPGKDGNDDSVFDACKRAVGGTSTSDCFNLCCNPTSPGTNTPSTPTDDGRTPTDDDSRRVPRTTN